MTFTLDAIWLKPSIVSVRFAIGQKSSLLSPPRFVTVLVLLEDLQREKMRRRGKRRRKKRTTTPSTTNATTTAMMTTRAQTYQEQENDNCSEDAPTVGGATLALKTPFGDTGLWL